MSAASRELLASREDVWGFLAEPNHLTDWWPGMRGVEPDRRGFSAGARWKVFGADERGLLGLPGKRRLGRPAPGTLVITALVPLERWSWQLVRPGRVRVSTLHVEVALSATSHDRTLVTVEAPGRGVARLAVDRLYELVQTAATL